MNFLIISIDTECDKTTGWNIQRPLSFSNISEGVAKFLQPLFQKYKIRPTYLLSPEVIADPDSAAYFMSIAGDAELGAHLHSEFIEPDANFSAERASDYQSDYPASIEEAKLKNLTLLFENTFGFMPLSFRGGRFGIGPSTLSILEKLGYRVDSSVSPDTYWVRNNNGYQNFLGAPYQPYFPSVKDFRKKGSMKIIELPVTMYNRRLLPFPAAIKQKIKINRRWKHFVYKALFRPGKNLLWLRPTWFNAHEMLSIAKKMIANVEKENFKTSGNSDVYLCMMFHSNEYTLGCSPYSMTGEHLATMKRNLEDFLRLMDEMQVKPIGLSEVRI
jgi:hypothetical protein